MSIKRRDVLYSEKGGQVKFLDWAITMTSVGACAEPFVANDRGGRAGDLSDFDPSDIMVKVDGLLQVEDEGAAQRALTSDGVPLHGGNLLPRVFLFTGNERGAV